MIFHMLTASLVVLKLLSLITISWFFVILPSLISLFIVIIVMLIAGLLAYLANK